jgi:AraC-like DNA-binding protein
MIPPHLLFLGHALCNDVVYQRSDSGTVSTKTSRALSHLNFFLSSGQPTLRGSAQEQTTGQPRGYRGHVCEIKSHLTISSTIVIRSSIEVFNCNYLFRSRFKVRLIPLSAPFEGNQDEKGLRRPGSPRLYRLAENQPHCGFKDLAAAVNLSPSHVERLFKLVTGEEIRHHLLRVRLVKAARLLETTEMRIKDITYAIGYEQPSSLVSAFRRMYSASPPSIEKSVRLDRKLELCFDKQRPRQPKRSYMPDL